MRPTPPPIERLWREGLERCQANPARLDAVLPDLAGASRVYVTEAVEDVSKVIEASIPLGAEGRERYDAIDAKQHHGGE